MSGDQLKSVEGEGEREMSEVISYVGEEANPHPTMPLGTPPRAGEVTSEFTLDSFSPPTPQGLPLREDQPPRDAGGDLTYKPLTDEFFKTIFYFSGMGTVIGSALEEGVHVEERHRGRAVDSDHIPHRVREQLHREEFPLVVRLTNFCICLYFCMFLVFFVFFLYFLFFLYCFFCISCFFCIFIVFFVLFLYFLYFSCIFVFLYCFCIFLVFFVFFLYFLYFVYCLYL